MSGQRPRPVALCDLFGAWNLYDALPPVERARVDAARFVPYRVTRNLLRAELRRQGARRSAA